MLGMLVGKSWAPTPSKITSSIAHSWVEMGNYDTGFHSQTTQDQEAEWIDHGHGGQIK